MQIKTKQNLRKLLMTVSPKEERESLVLESNSDLSQGIEMLAQSIGNLFQKHERLEKDLIAYVEKSIEKAKGHITEDLDGFKDSINKSFSEITSAYANYDKDALSKTNSSFKGLQKELKEKIVAIYKDMETMSSRMNNMRPSTWGGASIIQYLNGQTASPQNMYSNINWIFEGCTVTAVNNNQTQQVDVTITVTGGGSSGTAVYNEVVAGSGIDWVLANVPTVGTVRLYANGQRLTPGGVDYDIIADAITTLTSWDAGVVLADYNY